MKKVVFYIEGLDCAHCAANMEHAVTKMDHILSCHIDFLSGKVSFETDVDDLEGIKMQVFETMQKHEDGITMVNKASKKSGSHSHHHEHGESCGCSGHHHEDGSDHHHHDHECGCGHDHHDHDDHEACGCNHHEQHDHHDHDEHDGNGALKQLILGVILFVVGLFLKDTMQIVVLLASYLVLGFSVLKKAISNIGKGRVFDENFLMAVATIAAIYLQDYKEAVAVMLFYQVGEYFQDLAVDHSRKSISSLMDIRPEVANVLQDGDWNEVLVETVEIGDVILVKPGERIPLDGKILKGKSSLDTSSLTGESDPVDVQEDDLVLSGTLNMTGVLEVKVEKTSDESMVAKILELVENSDETRASSETFISKFARWYTPTVVCLAVVVALVVGFFGAGFQEGIYRACTFLVISCPCALVISIPLSFFAGIGGLSKQGILVKGASMVETLAKIDTVVFDKTGTLTTGQFHVSKIYPADDVLEESVLRDANIGEVYSNHPIALGLKQAFTEEIDESKLSFYQEIAGRGISVMYEEDQLLVGNARLMEDYGIQVEKPENHGTVVFVAKNNHYQGCILLVDTIKEDAKTSIEKLQKMHKKCVMVSGDQLANVELAKQELGLDLAYGNTLPQDKVEIVSALKESGKTCFVGDGVNDAPVLAVSDLGMAMGGVGSDAAIEAADVVLMKDKVNDIPLAISASQRVLKVANENIYGAIIVKVLVLILGALGYANMWMAIFADTGVALLCVINAMRLLRVKQY